MYKKTIGEYNIHIIYIYQKHRILLKQLHNQFKFLNSNIFIMFEDVEFLNIFLLFIILFIILFIRQRLLIR